MRRCRRFLSTSASRSEAGSILFLSPSLWPEPSSSAAGVRTSNLLQHFASESSLLFDSVHYGCGAPKPSTLTEYAHLHSLSTDYGIEMHDIPPNKSDGIKDMLSKDFPALRVVLFDRYFSEEAYSFHFRQLKPTVLRILDMQDFHALRLARQKLVETSSKNDNGHWMDDDLTDRLMACVPDYGNSADELQHSKKRKKGKNASDILLRELASIHRSDLTLVCSREEFDMLTEVFSIDPSKLCLAPFFSEENAISYESPAHQFDQRKDFCVLGGLRHPPNVDSVKWLKSEIWPKISDQVPDAKVHVWGSYAPQHIMELNDPKKGFLVHGKLDSLSQELSTRRVLLAPLRFGAGIKGKIVDAWEHGTPVVTTPIGAEGTTMSRDCLKSCTARSGQITIDDTGWGGLVATDADAIARCAVRLYKDQSLWDEARTNSRRLLRIKFNKQKNLSAVSNAVEEALLNRTERRSKDHIGYLLWHQSMRATEYFSRWIELKENK
mmetsp:Transcript_20285/g.58237  ORF Transcript_20285/g.58237 Transcript_20285/m.58237 type:complete len:494 (+) Transcript_20285:27-1508(+)